MTINSYDALIDFIKQGGNYSKESPGAPIAYKLSYLKDNSPARMSFTTNYDVKDCARVSAKKFASRSTPSRSTTRVATPVSDLELYGRIFAEGTNQGTLFEKNDSNYVVIHEGNMFGGGHAHRRDHHPGLPAELASPSSSTRTSRTRTASSTATTRSATIRRPTHSRAVGASPAPSS